MPCRVMNSVLATGRRATHTSRLADQQVLVSLSRKAGSGMRGRFRPHSWWHKFAHAFRGMRRALRTQHSFAVHLAVAAVVVMVASVLQVTSAEWGLLVLAIGLVLAAETFNTAIESLARAVDTAFHPRLRDALDMASAAV